MIRSRVLLACVVLAPVFKLAIPRHQPEIIRAIEQSRSPVTAGDVAIATGMNPGLVEQALLALAVDVGGHLRVAGDGVVAYVFPRNLQVVLASRYGWMRVQNVLRKSWKMAFYLLRISFGIMLIGLIVAVGLALALVLIVKAISDSNGEGVDLSSLFDPSLLEALFRFDPRGLPSEPIRSIPGPASQRIPAKAPLSFLEAFFSILFGDGNPNADLEERRWRWIAALIRSQKGVLIAEQLSPYLDRCAGGVASEEDVLLALVRFNGQPKVSPAGDLVYCFPDLQVTAQGRQGAAVEALQQPGFLKEHHWRFSLASRTQKTVAGVLVAVLLVLSLALFHSVAISAAGLAGWSALLAGVALAGLGYGCACLFLPLCRYVWLTKTNAGIAQRNASRRQMADLLKHPSPAILRKLDYAQSFAAERHVDASQLVYTSEKHLLTQELEQDQAISADWQQRLNDRSMFRF
ncbi:MAG: hypothetical protein ACKO45_05625 [Cyanobium sp.]